MKIGTLLRNPGTGRLHYVCSLYHIVYTDTSSVCTSPREEDIGKSYEELRDEYGLNGDWYLFGQGYLEQEYEVVSEGAIETDDIVKAPSYYADKLIETMAYIEDTCNHNTAFDAYAGYQFGTVTKYGGRAGMKIYHGKTQQESLVLDLEKGFEHWRRWLEHERNKL